MALAKDPSSLRFVFGIVLSCCGGILFSAKAILVKLIYPCGVDAVTILTLRLLFALPFFVLFAIFTKKTSTRPLSRREVVAVLVMGLTGYYLTSYFDFRGLKYINVGLARLILFMYPTFVLAFAVMFRGKKISIAEVLALIISYGGLVLLFWNDARTGGANIWLGTAFVFAAAVSYSVYVIMSGELLKRISALRLVSLATIAACCFAFIHFAIAHELQSLLMLDSKVYLLSSLNGVLCTVIPAIFLMMGIDRCGASVASQAGMISPVATIILGAVILGEPIGTIQIAGSLVVITGIFTLSIGQKRKQKRREVGV